MKNCFLLLFILGLTCGTALAETTYPFSCKDAKINASIKYSVIGRYQAKFSECTGKIVYNDTQDQIKAVELQITTKSIGSNCDWCDKTVLSKQLLDAATYPFILFKSDSFLKNDKNYEVSGSLDLHGKLDSLKSPFAMEEFIDPKDGKPYMRIKGKWIINRKDFNITWNKVLDQGGVLVGNHITVNWEILLKK